MEVLNLSGFDIKGLYITAHNYRYWGKNLLDSTLKSGDSKMIYYDPSVESYDMKIVFLNNSHREWTNDPIKVNDARWRITIYRDGSENSDHSMKFRFRYD